MLSGLEEFPRASGRGGLARGPLGMRHTHHHQLRDGGRTGKERGSAAIDPWHNHTHTHTHSGSPSLSLLGVCESTQRAPPSLTCDEDGLGEDRRHKAQRVCGRKTAQAGLLRTHR